jgi:hypothetical protein
MMSDFDVKAEKYGQTFRQLAEIVNQQPEEAREVLRGGFGEYQHDIKHTLGLITGANTIIQRDLEDGCEDFDSAEMIQIVTDAALRINQYVNLLNENFTTLIDADVIK